MRLTAFVPDHLFLAICTANSLGKQRQLLSLGQKLGLFTVLEDQDSVSLWNTRQSYLLLLIKDWGTQSSVLLSLDANYSVGTCHLMLLVSASGNQDLDT